MCRLVIGAPCSYCISNMAASKFNLRIITHDGEEVMISFQRKSIGWRIERACE